MSARRIQHAEEFTTCFCHNMTAEVTNTVYIMPVMTETIIIGSRWLLYLYIFVKPLLTKRENLIQTTQYYLL